MTRLMELLEGKTGKAGAAVGRRPRRRGAAAATPEPAAAPTPSRAASTSPMSPLTLGVREAATTSGLSLRYLRSEIKKGNLRTVRKGRRVLVPVDSLKEFLGLN